MSENNHTKTFDLPQGEPNERQEKDSEPLHFVFPEGSKNPSIIKAVSYTHLTLPTNSRV